MSVEPIAPQSIFRWTIATAKANSRSDFLGKAQFNGNSDQIGMAVSAQLLFQARRTIRYRFVGYVQGLGDLADVLAPGMLIPSEIAHHSDFKSPAIPK